MTTAVMSESALTFLPEGSLTIEVGRSFSAAGVSAATESPEKTRFVLFSEEWINLQVYIQSVLQLPITSGEFEADYGTFEEAYKGKVDAAVSAMRDVNALSKTFGSPKAIRDELAKDGKYLQNGDQKEIYAHIIWLASKIQSTANFFKYTSASLMDVIGPSAGTVEQRKENLKEILAGEGGLVSQAATMVTLSANLLERLAKFAQELSRANAALAEFTTIPKGKDSDKNAYTKSILEKAEEIIGNLKNDIEDHLREADAARKAWRDYTIAASSVSGGLLLITGGLLVPIVAAIGGGLGGVAQKQKNRYNELMRRISSERLDLLQKTKLKVDLTGLGNQIKDVKQTLTGFLGQLDQIHGVWLDTHLKLDNMTKDHALDQVIKTTWIVQKAHIEAAQGAWREIAEATKDFTMNSLIQFDLSVNYGERIP